MAVGPTDRPVGAARNPGHSPRRKAVAKSRTYGRRVMRSGQATRLPGVNRRGHAQPCRQIDAVGMRGRAGAFLSAGEAAEATGVRLILV